MSLYLPIPIILPITLCTLIIQGTISVGVDATDLFDRYDEDFEEMPGGGFPHIEINKMHISQSIEVKQSTLIILQCFLRSISEFIYVKQNYLSSGSFDKF